MELILYRTQDNENVINKNIEELYRFPMTLKNDVDISQPILVLNDKGIYDFRKCNFAYIEEFKRFYFIRSIDNVSNTIWNLNLECDVLESFKNDIFNSYAEYTRNIKEGDYQETSQNTDVRKEIDIFTSDIDLGDNKTIILTTIGG